MRKVLLLILTALILCSSCDKKETLSDRAIAPQASIPENQTQISLSPDGKYRAEAYGTDTGITAGGLFPYEGIRVIDAANDNIIWKMEPGYYTVSFSWSPDSRYIGIYYEARIWGKSIIFDVTKENVISLPSLADIASHYDDSVKPQENRPDPYFKITGWEDPETIIVDFRWNMKDADYFNGQYTFNIKTNTVCYK